MNDDLINNLEENIEELPEEARGFIFGDGLKNAEAEIFKNIDLAEEKLKISNMIKFYLLDIKSLQDLSDLILSLTINKEKKVAVAKMIKEDIIDELILLSEVHEEIDREAGSVTATISPNSLASLSDRLKQASIATPLKRDYSLNTEKTAAPAHETPSRAIDPYHESIDNE
ncbi:MAG: hypothetical protein V4478_02225 [Patescibacteria group bacterium]